MVYKIFLHKIGAGGGDIYEQAEDQSKTIPLFLPLLVIISSDRINADLDNMYNNYFVLYYSKCIRLLNKNILWFF